MLKYSFLILISLTCLASEPKFHFMDCVKITKGFYRGCVGKVGLYFDGKTAEPNYYEVQVEDCKGGAFYANFIENELKECKK